MEQLEVTKSFKNIKLELVPPVAIIKLDRPQVLNALNDQTLSELDQVVSYLEQTEEILGVILTGEGKGFAAGADIAQMRDYGSWEGRDYANRAQTLFSRIETLEKPVLAAVNGYALGGGCELAMSCDIRLASEKAVFGQPEVSLGLIPCFGGTQRLPRLVGAGIAKELIFTGRNVKAEEALRIGLVNRVVPHEALMEEAMAVMKQITAKAPIAVGSAKTAINRGIDLDLANGLELEKDLAGLVFGTQDKQEGVEAFLAKRAPEFHGC